VKIGDLVRFNGAEGEVVAVSDLVRKDWEGNPHTEWPPMVQVQLIRGRKTWFPPEILELVRAGSPMDGHDSECESRRKVQVFGGATYCASCGGFLTSRQKEPASGVCSEGEQ
jgi:hypothetical protein